MFLFVGILVACQPRERVIDYPAFQAKNSASLEISRIVLNDTATVIYADVEQYPGGPGWIPGSISWRTGKSILP